MPKMLTEPQEGNGTAEFDFTFGGNQVKVVLEFHFSENAEDFIDTGEFVEGASSAILAQLM